MRNLHALRRPIGLLAFFSALAAAPTLSAQTDDQRAQARALATEGATAFNEGRFKEAADLFSKAESLVHAPTHLLFLGRSYAKIGQLVRAQEAYNRVVREQLPANAPPQFRDAQAAAQEEMRAIEPRIARLTIQIKGAQEEKDLAVTVDGRPIPPVMVGVPQPFDPGEHRVEAVAAGKRAQPQNVTLRDGERAAITLELHVDPTAMPPGAPVAGAAAATTAAQPAPGQQPPTGIQDSSVSSQSAPAPSKVPAYVALGVGAVGLGVGTIFGIQYLSKSSEADDACTPTSCPESVVQPLDADAATAGTISLVGLGVGVAGIGTGVALLMMSGGSKETTSAAFTPLVGPRYVGLRGRF